MTIKYDNRVPNPPKAVQRGLGLLNPPNQFAGRNAISPSPPRPTNAEGLSESNDYDDESATQRIQVGFLQQRSPEEPSATEPLLLRNLRLKEKKPLGNLRTIPMANIQTPEQKKTKSPAYDLDEDAVTKKIIINRVVTVSPGHNDVHTSNTHVRVETVDAIDNRNVPTTTGEFRNPLASERPTDLTALGRATKADRDRIYQPTLMDRLKKLLSLFTPNYRGNDLSEGAPLIEPTENQYNIGVNSYSSELYKEMRHSLVAGPGTRNKNLPVPRFKYLVSRPPRIVLKGFLVRREKNTSLMLRGRAIHPLCVRDIMIFANKKKVLYLSSAARNDAGCIEFSADIPLLGDTSHILVVARHNEEVMGSQSLYVRRES